MDRKLVVYRVQDAYGFGPYDANGPGFKRSYPRDGFPWAAGGTAGRHLNPSHPPPAVEGLTGDEDDFLCGFATMRQYWEWFSRGERHNLHRLGWSLVRRKVWHGQVKFGDFQIVMDREAWRSARSF